MTVKMLFGGMLPLLGLMLIGGCSESPTEPSGPGQVRLIMVDAPAAGLEQVNIVVTRVEVHAAGSDSASGWVTVNDTTATYDLLTLTNGANSVIGDKMLPAGKYTQIRLSIGAGSNVVIDGVSFSLDVASATGLKLNHNFDIAENTLYVLTLDFDAARSIRPTNDNQYRLLPVIRVVANAVSGTISGIINPVAVKTTITTTVAGVDTVSTVSDTTDGSFRLVALPAGIYDVTIAPDDSNYRDTTIAGVQVVATHDTSIGTVTLSGI